MRTMIRLVEIFFVFVLLGYISDAVKYGLGSIGKTEQVKEISFPEEITIQVGDEIQAPIQMLTDGGYIAEEDIPKICKQYQMVWITDAPDVVLAKRDGTLVAGEEGTTTLYASSFNTKMERIKTKVHVVAAD